MTTQTDVVDAVLETVSETAAHVKNGLVGRRGKIETDNPSGETPLEADVWADEVFAERLCAIDGISEYASEERQEVLTPEDEYTAAGDGYSVAIDPLDGSSNLESNNPVGTVFGVYDAPLPASGRDMIAAGYVLYGPLTTLVMATEGKVTEYEITGTERTVLNEDIQIPEEPVVYGFGGRVPNWTEPFTAYVRELEQELKLRYGGAMMADVSQVLNYGGIFGYPGLQDNPKGKLRSQFETYPIAYIVESAGGRSSAGDGSVLDVEATSLHQRTPLFVGNDELIERLESALR